MKTLTNIEQILENAKNARELGIFGKSYNEQLSNTFTYMQSKKEEIDKEWKEYFSSVGIDISKFNF